MDKELKKEIESLEASDRRMEESFTRHLEIYAQNGKEMARLAQAVENLTEAFKEYKESNKEVLKWAKNMKWGQKTIVGLVGIVGTIVGIVIAVIKYL